YYKKVDPSGVSTVGRMGKLSRSQLSSQFSSLVDLGNKKMSDCNDNDNYRLPRPKLIVPTHSYGKSDNLAKVTGSSRNGSLSSRNSSSTSYCSTSSSGSLSLSPQKSIPSHTNN